MSVKYEIKTIDQLTREEYEELYSEGYNLTGFDFIIFQTETVMIPVTREVLSSMIKRAIKEIDNR
ncbi:MAG: hypothetical protein QXU98_14030 [Candidatus Parvarchaeota archaeon]